MIQCFRVFESPLQVEIQHIADHRRVVDPHGKVFRLNVSVDEVHAMDIFESSNHLIREQKSSFQRKLVSANNEEVVEAWA